MNISRLPGDLLLNVAYQIDDAEALVNIAQVWRPMRTMITSGHATDLEAKLRLKETKMIQGPNTALLRRGETCRTFISRILQYSIGWSDLQWASKKVFGVPTPVDVQWNDGTTPAQFSFGGESGGCIYNVHYFPASWHCELSIMRPPSVRTGRPVTQYKFLVTFSIIGVAIDVSSKEVVLLERPPQNGDAILHFYDFDGRVLRSPYLWHASWFCEVIVRQFEVVDGMLGLLTSLAVEPKGWSMFLDWKDPDGQLQWVSLATPSILTGSIPAPQPHTTGEGDHWGFQFIKRDLVLISERSHHPQTNRVAAHLRLVPLSYDYQVTQDPRNNWIQELPLVGLQPFERVLKATLVPYVAPILGQKPDHAAPFFFDPSERLIGIKYEFLRSWGEVEHILEISQIGDEGIQLLQSLNYPARHQIAGDYAFIGRYLVWPMGITHNEGRNGLFIRSVDFTMTPRPLLPPRTSNRHPKVEAQWVVVKDAIQSNNPRLPQLSVTTTVNPPRNTFRAVFTQDNIIFLSKGIPNGTRDSYICALSYNF